MGSQAAQRQRLRALAVLFPLYWLAITSFKLPIQVNKGPVYLPFVDFHPSLDAWHYIFVDLRDDTLRPYINSVVVAVGSSTLAMLLGSTAASSGPCRTATSPSG